MTKKKKLSTPEWILEGYDSNEEYNKAKGIRENKKSGKTFRIRKCPKCDSDEVSVVVGQEAKGQWECKKCKWKGKDVKKEELTEDEFMKYMSESPLGVPQSSEFRGRGEEVV